MQSVANGNTNNISDRNTQNSIGNLWEKAKQAGDPAVDNNGTSGTLYQ
jgi:hypothetical protein